MAVMTSWVPPTIPQEHLDLEIQIQHLQALRKNIIPEERFKDLLAQVALGVIKSLAVAAEMRSCLQTDSILFVAQAIILHNDCQLKRTGTAESLPLVVLRLKENLIGVEALLRVVRVISELTVCGVLRWPAPECSLQELHQAAIIFAAQPLLARLRGEEAYVQATGGVHTTTWQPDINFL